MWHQSDQCYEHELSDNRNGNYILNTQRESTHDAKNSACWAVTWRTLTKLYNWNWEVGVHMGISTNLRY